MITIVIQELQDAFRKKRPAIPVWSFIVLASSLAACSTKQLEDPLFLPPTIPIQAVAAPSLGSPAPPANTEPAETPYPTPTPLCDSGLTFLKDLTIPDGTVVQPGDKLDKRWLVENSGSCNWNRDYSLVLISGPDMGAPREQALYPARSGSTAVIRIIYAAPDEPGTYRSAWQARDARGELFGDPVFIEVVVSTP